MSCHLWHCCRIGGVAVAWLESHQSLGDHPKTRKAARLLGIGTPQLVGHLMYLWWWALDYAEDGDIGKFSDDDIAFAARWDGDAVQFARALVECSFGEGAGFIDRRGDQPQIHDWWEYAGKLIEKRRADAERKRIGRTTEPPRPTATTPVSVQRMSVGHPADGSATAYVTNHTNQPTATNQPTNPDQPSPARDDESSWLPTYCSTLNGTYPNVVKSFSGLTNELSEGWLRTTLAEVEQDVGPLPRDALQEGIGIAFQQVRRALDSERKGGRAIATARGLAKKIILTSLKEQAHGTAA